MAAQALRVVASAEAPSPPYPVTRVKGWKFTLDYERIEQSDTWALATPDMRPWLLMVWLTAWRQAPAGSLPSSDELISARIGMPERQFAANRDILMRGWWLASDGRLYHSAITEQVLDMMARRSAEADRKHAWREKNQGVATNVPRDNSGTPPSATTPEPEPVPEPKTQKQVAGHPAPSAASASLRRPSSLAGGLLMLSSEGVDEQLARDWLAVRKGKPLTKTALDGAKREAQAAGVSLPDALRLAAERGWIGFKASWLDRAPVAGSPREKIVDLYHSALPELPPCSVMDEYRGAAIDWLWSWVMTSTKRGGARRATTEAEGLDWLRVYFERARESDWAMGRMPSGWRAGIDDLCSAKGLKQVVEKVAA